MNEAYDRKRRVVVGESGLGPYGQVAVSRRHVFTADEPESLGGYDTGPDPLELLLSSLAACTVMTIRMYVNRRRIDVGKITVTVEHEWVRDETGKTRDIFRRLVHVDPRPTSDVLNTLLEVAERCPVHKAITNSPIIETHANP